MGRRPKKAPPPIMPPSITTSRALREDRGLCRRQDNGISLRDAPSDSTTDTTIPGGGLPDVSEPIPIPLPANDKALREDAGSALRQDRGFSLKE